MKSTGLDSEYDEELAKIMERPEFKLLYEMLSVNPAMQMLSYSLCRWLEESSVHSK